MQCDLYGCDIFRPCSIVLARTYLNVQEWSLKQHTRVAWSHTHKLSMVTKEGSVIQVCVNDSLRCTGEDGENSGCDLLWSNASWDTTKRFKLQHTDALHAEAQTWPGSI